MLIIALMIVAFSYVEMLKLLLQLDFFYAEMTQVFLHSK